jgi:hypothetical protein
VEDIKPFSQLRQPVYAQTKYDSRIYEIFSFLSRDDKIRKLVIFKKGYYFRRVKSDSTKGVYIHKHRIYYRKEGEIIYPDSLSEFLIEVNEIHQAYLRHRKLNKLIKD